MTGPEQPIAARITIANMVAAAGRTMAVVRVAADMAVTSLTATAMAALVRTMTGLATAMTGLATTMTGPVRTLTGLVTTMTGLATTMTGLATPMPTV
jgi:hypothetical protein